jgi:hypothetical protein
MRELWYIRGMRGLAQQSSPVPNPDRLRVLCPDDECPVMDELVRCRADLKQLRLSLGIFLACGGLAAAVLWWKAERRG